MKYRVWFHSADLEEKACLDFEETPLIPRKGEIVDSVQCMFDHRIYVSGTVEDVHYSTHRPTHGDRKMIVNVFLS